MLDCDNASLFYMVTKVLFVKNSLDGFAAAYAAWVKLRQSAIFLPVDPTEPPYTELGSRALKLKSEKLPLMTDEDVIFLLGFCYPLPILEQMHSIGVLSVIDHHPESVTSYKGVNWFKSERSDYSTCAQAWQYWHPDVIVPDLLAYVSDHTIGETNRHPETKTVIEALSKYPKDLVMWHTYCQAPSVPEFSRRLLAYSNDPTVSFTL